MLKQLSNLLMGGLAASALLLSSAQADWRKDFPEIRYAVTASEAEADMNMRLGPFVAYMGRELGVPVRIYRTTDYAAAVEAMRADQVEFFRVGPAAYALADRVMGDKAQPIATDVTPGGVRGYYSKVFVRADSPFQRIEDLQGKVMAFVDPNSASGFQAPNYYLNQAGINPNSYFANTVFSGSHENSIMGVINGQFDAAFNWWHNDNRSNPHRMADKGMINLDDLRIIWSSEMIPNTPYVARGDLPEELKELFVQALIDMPVKDPDAWQALTDGQVEGVVRATRDDYLDIIAITEANQAERRRR